MSKHIVSTSKAPAAIGVYSQAARVGNTIWVSGQIPLDPATQALVTGDMEAQVRQVFQNLKAIVVAAGATLDDVVKVTVYVKTIAAFSEIADIRLRYFPTNGPASAIP